MDVVIWDADVTLGRLSNPSDFYEGDIWGEIWIYPKVAHYVVGAS